LLTGLIFSGIGAAAPALYRESFHESPVQGAPDDLLLLAGFGLNVDDAVVYQAIRTAGDLTAPATIPERSGAAAGVASIVSSASVPYSLTVRLPSTLQADHPYALWVKTRGGAWSRPVTINDARPLWISPAYVYSSDLPGPLPRELKIIGRNLGPSSGRPTLIRLIGPERFIGKALADDPSSEGLGEFVARLRLPQHLAPGHYRVSVNREGGRWIDLDEQTLEVLPDAHSAAEFRVDDLRYGGCRPNDGADDTACIVRAVAAAARAGGGAVYFAAGTWDLVDSAQPGVAARDGIVVPPGVQLQGAGSALTRLDRHARWNAEAPTAAFSLTGYTLVSGFDFRDLQVYKPRDQAGSYLQLGLDWQRANSAPAASARVVHDVIITRNVFDKPMVAISSGGLPIERLIVTYNVFGAFHAALELVGDQYNVNRRYRLDESIIDFNIFKPGSDLDPGRSSGSIASEIGAGYRVDFSGNSADGAATDYLYAPDDAKGWRAAFFWSTNDNVEEVLVSQNEATCTGDKIGDGEAIAFDSNTNTFAFATLPMVERATLETVAVSAELAGRQHEREVPIASYYVGHWVQIVSGPGLGEVRKIVGYTTDEMTHVTTIRVAPDWDVVPVPRASRVAIGREYWQLYVLNNHVDNRQPLCQKSNRSRRVGGVIGLWAQSADSVVAGNHQYDSDGIFVQQNQGFVTQNAAASDHPCPGCTLMGLFNFFLDIRNNLVDGEYDWANDCSRSGIGAGVAAASWEGDGPPPTVSFGVSIAHNTIRHADEQYGGAIALVNTWTAGPTPHRWPLSDGLLIHHNAISDIEGQRAMAICGTSRPRIGIAFPDPAIAWRTVLYANSCRNVSLPIGPGGIDTVKVCPSSVSDSCECP
jgi:hypothetical protein